MKIIETKDYDALSRKACEIVLQTLKETEKPVLGLATGSTPEGLYQYLIQAYQSGEVSFKDVTTFNLDEYVGLDADDPNSYHYFMNDKFIDHIDILKENVFIPNGMAEDIEKECNAYEEKIRTLGPIDLQVLGIGLNGHIGFNEPGTSFSSRTHMVKLKESTRQANARFFASIEEVPTHAVTMGIDTIMESKEILLLISGSHKADTLAQLVNAEVSETFPASVLKNHPNVTLIADEGALEKVNK